MLEILINRKDCGDSRLGAIVRFEFKLLYGNGNIPIILSHENNKIEITNESNYAVQAFQPLSYLEQWSRLTSSKPETTREKRRTSHKS